MRILCVEDNADVVEVLRTKLTRETDATWLGGVESTDGLMELVCRENPELILMDIDIPGRDTLEVLAEVAVARPAIRVVVFSGHVTRALIERAIDAGAWAYVSKNDGDEALLSALRRVQAGEFVLSPEARLALDYE